MTRKYRVENWLIVVDDLPDGRLGLTVTHISGTPVWHDDNTDPAVPSDPLRLLLTCEEICVEEGLAEPTYDPEADPGPV